LACFSSFWYFEKEKSGNPVLASKTSPFRAPGDCYQYLAGVSGNIKSFNFDGKRMLKSQLYTACVRQEMGMNDRFHLKEITCNIAMPFRFDETVG
jgi:hypothetical protein